MGITALIDIVRGYALGNFCKIDGWSHWILLFGNIRFALNLFAFKTLIFFKKALKMPRNVEIKAKVKNLEEVKSAAASLSNTDGQVILQRDVFFKVDAGMSISYSNWLTHFPLPLILLWNPQGHFYAVNAHSKERQPIVWWDMQIMVPIYSLISLLVTFLVLQNCATVIGF